MKMDSGILTQLLEELRTYLSNMLGPYTKYIYYGLTVLLAWWLFRKMYKASWMVFLLLVMLIYFTLKYLGVI